MNTKLKCLLLDDELPGLSYLKLLCEQIPDMEVVKAFNDPEKFLKEIGELDFDLCILDIEMPGISGIKIAENLKDKPVIFTTAYKEYASTAFDLDAVDYIIKPVRLDRLKHAVNKAIQQINVQNNASEFFLINTEKGNSLIYFDQLVYVYTSEVDSRDKVAFLRNGSSLVLKNISFEKLIAQLPQANFCRINKQELIAIKHIQHFSTDQVSILPGAQTEKPLILHLGEAFRSEFIRKVYR